MASQVSSSQPTRKNNTHLTKLFSERKKGEYLLTPFVGEQYHDAKTK